MDLASRRRRSTNAIAVVFLLPTFFFLIVFIFRSIFYTFQISTLDWSSIASAGTPVGLGNWLKLLTADKLFWLSVRNNIVMMIGCLVIQMPIAMLIAFVLDNMKRGGKTVKMIYFLPLLMSSVAIGFLFKRLFDAKYGLAGAIMSLFIDKPVNMLGNKGAPMLAVLLVIAWQYIPFYMLYFFAGITTISSDVYEATVIDGATRLQYIFRVAIPMMMDTIKSAAIMCMVGSLKYFDLVYVMTEGGPSGKTELMATYMYSNAFDSLKMGYGSTIAGAMFIIITAVSLVTFKVMYWRKEA
jgi:ABC-type sugar transport system permease subunit